MQAGLLRVVAVAIPIAAGVLASIVFSHAVHYPHGWESALLWWIAALSLSTVSVAVVERQCRRLLPLATLLKLSMVFPDKAPSRFGVALRAGTVRNLEQRVVEMRRRGVDDEPSRAAAQILELVGALGVHDRATRGHAERVRAYSDLLGAQLDLSQDDRDRLRWAALLHDVGKVAVPTEVLNKPGKPDEGEWEILHRHPEEGARLAAPLRSWLGEWADTIEQHHERWDGLGYPHGLKGEQISRGARIVAVADSFEVMTATRSYKRPMDVKAAREELTDNAGTQFDPAMVRAFLNISLGRMRWMVGPLAWIAELPFLRGIPWEAGGQAAGMAARVVAGATIFGVAAAPGATASSAQTAAPAAPSTTTSTAPVPVVSHAAAIAPPTTAPAPTRTTSAPVSTPTTVAPAEMTPVTTAPRTPTPTTPPTTAKPLGPNQPPIAGNDSATTTANSPIHVDLTANDSDPDGDGLAYPVTISYPSGGKNANVNLLADGHTINYVPNNHQAPGPDSFQYTVCDTRGACSSATVTITVTA